MDRRPSLLFSEYLQKRLDAMSKKLEQRAKERGKEREREREEEKGGEEREK